MAAITLVLASAGCGRVADRTVQIGTTTVGVPAGCNPIDFTQDRTVEVNLHAVRLEGTVRENGMPIASDASDPVHVAASRAGAPELYPLDR